MPSSKPLPQPDFLLGGDIALLGRHPAHQAPGLALRHHVLLALTSRKRVFHDPLQRAHVVWRPRLSLSSLRARRHAQTPFAVLKPRQNPLERVAHNRAQRALFCQAGQVGSGVARAQHVGAQRLVLGRAFCARSVLGGRGGDDWLGV